MDTLDSAVRDIDESRIGTFVPTVLFFFKKEMIIVYFSFKA